MLKKLYQIYQLKLTVIASVAILLSTMLLPAQRVAAGANGEQIAIHTYVWGVFLDGYNQNDQHIQKCFDLVLDYPPASDGYSYLSNYWWKGTVYITYYQYSNCTQYQASDQVYIQPVTPVNWLWHNGPV